MEYQFHHLHIICADLNKIVDFFTKSLGGKYVSARKFGTADGAILDLAGVPVFLRVARTGEEVATVQARSFYGYHHIGLKVKDVDAAYAELTAQGYKFTTLPTATPGRGEGGLFRGTGKPHLRIDPGIKQHRKLCPLGCGLTVQILPWALSIRGYRNPVTPLLS